MTRKRLVIAVILAVLVALAVVSVRRVFASESSASVQVSQFEDIIAVSVASPSDVLAFQVVVFWPRDAPIMLISSSGFMQNPVHLSLGEEHRWFGLKQSGREGSLVFLVSEGCGLLSRVQLLDRTESRINTTSTLPRTVCG